jgi:4-hydroxybutyrate CoA-transferase
VGSAEHARAGRSTLEQVMSLVGPGSAVVASPGCGTPATLLRGLAERSHHVGVTLYSGLQIDGYPFLDAVHPAGFRLITWHVNGPLRSRVGDGVVEYVPARAAHVPQLLSRWNVNVALVRVSPPDRHGYHSLGPSASYPLTATRTAPIVIAEIDPDVPRTFGNWIHRSRITASIDSETPMPEYHAAAPDDTSTAIARRVVGVLPERPVLQLGIGANPEALTSHLGDVDLGPLRFVGMATDAMAHLHDVDRLDLDAVYPAPAILAAEVMGTRTVMEFVDQNPVVGVRESAHSHHPAGLRGLDRFVSVNSAVAVDLTGQVNAETVSGRQISGIGGSTDYCETAFASEGGLRILALPSTSGDGKHSRIVPPAEIGDTVTHPRSSIDIVVTEHGVADLRGRSLSERSELLIAISDPSFRDQLTSPTPPHPGDTT